MNLKQKYDQHKTTFNEKAWDSFTDLRKASSIDKNTTIKKYNMKNIILLFCLLFGIASLSLLFALNYNKGNTANSNNLNIQTQSTEKKQEKKSELNQTEIIDEALNQKIVTNNIQTKEQPTKTKQLTTNQNKVTAQTSSVNESTKNNNFGKETDWLLKDLKTDKATASINLSKAPFKPAKQVQIKKADRTKSEANRLPIQKKQATNNNIDNSKIDFQKSTSTTTATQIPNKANLSFIEIPQNNSIGLSTSNSSNTNKQSIALIQTDIKEVKNKVIYIADKMPTLQSDKLPQERVDLNYTKNIDYLGNNFIQPLEVIFTELEKNKQHLITLQNTAAKPEIYKNTFTIGLNIAPWSYVSGSIPYGTEFREVIKRGYFIDAGYRRRLNKILSVGLGFGYAHAKDVNNPELDTLDFETNIHAHARLYLFFINNQNNRAFIKIGGGFSHSERLHSGISALGPEEYERFMQWSNYNTFGLTIEASYERNITQQLFAGLNLGLSTGNDGFSYTGLSIGYSIK